MGTVLGACGDGSRRAAVTPGDATATAARATLVAAATAGLVPDGLVIATATPDTHLLNKLTPDGLRDKLARDPKLAGLFRAIEARDPEAMLDEFDWKETGCGGRLTPSCAPGATPGAPVEIISTGDDGSASRADVRTVLESLLRVMPSVPQFVAQSQSEPERYLIGFDANADTGARMPSWGGDPATTIGGVLLFIDTRAARPVQLLRLEPPYPAMLREATSLVAGSRGDMLMLLTTQR